jgi:opacity protein-like surface antigen
MKKILVGAAAAAALIAPGVASADVIGAIDYTYETTDYDSGNEFDAYSLGGAIATDVSHGLRLQADGRTTLQDWDGSSGDYSHGYAAAHLSGDLGRFNVGAFAGMLSYYDDGGVVYGVEGRTAFGALSVDAAIAFSDFGDNNYEGTHYRLGGSYFFMPNLAINAGYNISEIDSGTDYDVDEWTLGVGYQFANNIELFGNYSDAEYDYGFGGYDAESLQLGVRLNIGGGTLQENTNGGLWDAVRGISETYARW